MVGLNFLESFQENPDSYLPWLAVMGAWLSFGSFAVPMKWKSVVDAEVDPLVYQCYKTFWTFVTSHLVLFFQPYEFTWWGILSGLSWVPAGVAAVVAVQNVGIAYGQAIWQVTIIMTSCVWGFAILRDEQVQSWWGAGAALLCLVVGVVGMTISFNLYRAQGNGEEDLLGLEASEQQSPIPPEARHSAPAIINGTEARAVSPSDLESADQRSLPLPQSRSTTTVNRGLRSHLSAFSSVSAISAPRPCTRSTLSDVRFAADDLVPEENSQIGQKQTSMALGIGAALFNGTWGGSNLVPSKYAPLHGSHFVISFATGALIANVLLVILYVTWIKLGNGKGGVLPSPHFRTMALPGFLSGTMWSAGNFCSLYVVSTIGQGIGNSLIQSSVICSGLWGILLYREMSGKPVLFWSFFCAVCLGGVVLLALERKA